MKVRNVNGRRQHSCICGTWLHHWVKVSGRPIPQHCAYWGCMEKPQLGAHVQVADPDDPRWYIVPVCLKHSVKSSFMEISDTTILISAYVGDTCAREMPIGDISPAELKETLDVVSVETH